MDLMKADNSTRAGDGDLCQATFRELIVQLALTEEERRSADNPRRIAEIARREKAIVAALRRNELGLSCLSNSSPMGPVAVPGSVEASMVLK